MSKGSFADDSQKIWVGGLPDISVDDMKIAFGAAGTVTDVKQLRPGRTNQACITYSSATEAEAALKQFNGGDFNGFTLEVDTWTKKPKGKGGKGGGSGKGGKGKGKDKDVFNALQGFFGGNFKGKGKDGGKKPQVLRSIDASCKVWVGNLPPTISKEDMATAFSAAGKVKEAAHFGAAKGNTGCVAYETAEEAQQAIATFNGGDFSGYTLQVDVWSKAEGDEGGNGGKRSGGKGSCRQWQAGNCTYGDTCKFSHD